jgi:hypothetical protein
MMVQSRMRIAVLSAALAALVLTACRQHTPAQHVITRVEWQDRIVTVACETSIRAVPSVDEVFAKVDKCVRAVKSDPVFTEAVTK